MLSETHLKENGKNERYVEPNDAGIFFSERLLMSNVKRRGIVDIVGEIKASEKTYTQFRLTTT